MRVTPFAPAAWRRVLLVEDETRLREMLVRAVREMGFEIRATSTGEIALRFLEEKPNSIDIVILDLNLPGIGGMQLLENIHQNWPDIQAIILTGFGDLSAAKKAIQMDAVDFLSKPCALGELEVALDRARQRRVQRVPSELPIPAPPEPDDLGLSSSSSASSGSERGDAVSLEDIERRHILATLEKNHGNRTQTAAELGISLRKLYYRLGQYHREGLLSK